MQLIEQTSQEYSNNIEKTCKLMVNSINIRSFKHVCYVISQNHSEISSKYFFKFNSLSTL